MALPHQEHPHKLLLAVLKEERLRLWCKHSPDTDQMPSEADAPMTTLSTGQMPNWTNAQLRLTSVIGVGSPHKGKITGLEIRGTGCRSQPWHLLSGPWRERCKFSKPQFLHIESGHNVSLSIKTLNMKQHFSSCQCRKKGLPPTSGVCLDSTPQGQW